MSEQQTPSSEGASGPEPTGRPPTGGGPSFPPPGQPGAIPEPSVLATLFDFRFEHLVTVRVLRFFYVLAVVLGGLMALSTLITLASIAHGIGALIGIVVAGAWFLLFLLGARLAVEFLVVVFRLGEDVRVLRRERSAAGPGQGGARPAP